MTAAPAPGPQVTAGPEPDLVVFDGVCVLCNGFVRFVHRHDRAGQFRLATAQSPVGQGIYRQAGLSPAAMDTVLVRRQGRIGIQAEQLRKADHRVERRAQFVAHA